jgi:hypothetical protein
MQGDFAFSLARHTAAKNFPGHYHVSGMPLSRHKATSRAGLGEICGFRYERFDVAGIPANK